MIRPLSAWYPNGKGTVCKTVIRWFNSNPCLSCGKLFGVSRFFSVRRGNSSGPFTYTTAANPAVIFIQRQVPAVCGEFPTERRNIHPPTRTRALPDHAPKSPRKARKRNQTTENSLYQNKGQFRRELRRIFRIRRRLQTGQARPTKFPRR